MKTDELLDSIVEKAKKLGWRNDNIQVGARSGRADTAQGNNKRK